MQMAKKEITPGKNFTVATKKDESETVLNWLNAQSNLSDSIRYLIENDIIQNGVRNLQEYIPAIRKPIAANTKINNSVENNEEVDSKVLESWA